MGQFSVKALEKMMGTYETILCVEMNSIHVCLREISFWGITLCRNWPNDYLLPYLLDIFKNFRLAIAKITENV